MKNLVLTALVLTVAMSAAHAAPTYSLSFTTSGANWYMWCQQAAGSDANAGLASFTVDVVGTGTTVITKSTCKAPQFQYDPDNLINGGFTGFRNSGTVSGNTVTGIGAGQPTIYDGASDPAGKDVLVIKGIGQSAVAPLDINGSPTATIAYPVMLATGTFTGQGTFTFANALGNALNTPWVGPGNVTPIVFVPEPATMSLLVLGGLAALRRRRA